MRRCDRADDELHLLWLRHRQDGWAAASIASAYGVKSERVRVMLGRVRKDYAASAEGADVFGGKLVQ